MFWTIDQNFRKWLPRLQAHRGHWVGGLPQNSLAAMQSAFQLNYKMVECDVRLTADKQVVLFHDDRVQGQLIRNMSLEKLN